MSRFLFVAQEDTPRCFPLPQPMDVDMKKDLIKRLIAARTLKGTAKMTPGASAWYDSWYRSRRDSRRSSEKQFAGYYERKPDHILRLSMIMRLALGTKDFTIHKDDLVHATRILSWLEDWLPRTFDQLASSSVGEDQTRILRILRSAGGRLDHSTLLRRNSSRMNAMQFKTAIGTLREARLVELEEATHSYYLTPEGWS